MSIKQVVWFHLLLSFILVGCTRETRELDGQFIYTYPTGEVVVLSISTDHTYTQTFYKNKEEMDNEESPLYQSNGRWKKTGEDFAFKNWLSISESRNPHEMLDRPVNEGMLDVYFIDSYNDSKDYISIYKENGFVFERLE